MDKETIEELEYLLRDADRRLQTFLRDITKNKRHIHPDTFARVVATAKQYRQELSNIPIQEAREYLRTHQTLIGALITSTDWQSPSFAHTRTSQAGRETGKIYATINDYKRDQHWDAHRYEQAFLKEYVDAFIKIPVHVNATSSGMAAFTTILMFLLGEKKAKGNIVCGRSIYFENKGLINQIFADQIVAVDESKIIDAIDIHHPSVIFLDSLTNAPDIIVPDIRRVIKHLLKTKEETYLVIDNTGLSIHLQLIPMIFARRSNLRLILFESLNKYHQFGMDRVTGGIIIAYGKDTEKLFDWRVHASTNIPDITAASLPMPNRGILTKRFTRHTRNATFLVEALRNWILHHPNAPFEDISFPGIGSYFTIKFKKSYATIPVYKRFVGLSLSIAKRRGINLVSGTSFGLDTTRVYLTAIRSVPNIPFIRIAVGTEDSGETSAIRDLFIETSHIFSFGSHAINFPEVFLPES